MLLNAITDSARSLNYKTKQMHLNLYNSALSSITKQQNKCTKQQSSLYKPIYLHLHITKAALYKKSRNLHKRLKLEPYSPAVPESSSSPAVPLPPIFRPPLAGGTERIPSSNEIRSSQSSSPAVPLPPLIFRPPLPEEQREFFHHMKYGPASPHSPLFHQEST